MDKKIIGSPLGANNKTTALVKCDNKNFINGGTDSCIKIWDLSKNLLLHLEQTDRYRGIENIAVSPDKKSLAYFGTDEKLFIYDVNKGEVTKKFELPSYGYSLFSSICFLKNDKIFVTGTTFNFTIISINTGGMQTVINENKAFSWMKFICISENTHYIAAADYTNIYIIDTFNNFNCSVIENAARRIEQIIIKGENLFTVSVERSLCSVVDYKVTTNTKVNELKYSFDVDILCIYLSDDCNTLVICDANGCISLINIMYSSIIGKIYTQDTDIRTILFVEQENVIVTGSDKSGLKTWNLNKKTVVSLPETTSFLKDCDFSKSVFQKNESDEIKHLLKTNGAFVDSEDTVSMKFEFVIDDFDKHEKGSFDLEEMPINSILKTIEKEIDKLQCEERYIDPSAFIDSEEQ